MNIEQIRRIRTRLELSREKTTALMHGLATIEAYAPEVYPAMARLVNEEIGYIADDLMDDADDLLASATAGAQEEADDVDG